MSEQISSDFYKVPNVKIDILRLRNELEDVLKKKNIDVICLAGFMKILSKQFIKRFKGKIINIHPSLLPKYKGLDTHNRAINNNDKYNAKKTTLQVKKPNIKNTNKLNAKNCFNKDFDDSKFVIIMDWHSNDIRFHIEFQ